MRWLPLCPSSSEDNAADGLQPSADERRESTVAALPGVVLKLWLKVGAVAGKRLNGFAA
jgi:hypothetical protein